MVIIMEKIKRKSRIAHMITQTIEMIVTMIEMTDILQNMRKDTKDPIIFDH